MVSEIGYQEADGSWRNLHLKIRVRGNYRLNNCYFPPLKLKISKSERKGTVFKGNKKLKLVLPCMNVNSSKDYVIKELLAYRLFEVVTPYHFKTRLTDIALEDVKGKKSKNYELNGFLIEDIEKVADRYDGKVYERPLHPLNQGDHASVQNAFFQYMIGNTDYSTAGQHNQKLIYIDKEIIPVPYDFDMSGLVNTNYSVVSVINGESLPISSVRERLYRGFERNPVVINQVRQEFLDNQSKFIAVLHDMQDLFDDPDSYNASMDYLLKFFDTLNDDQKFAKEITGKLRSE